MEAYYFLSHRIAAVNTITLVRRDTAVHVASHTLSNKHRLPPSTNSSAHSKSLNFLHFLSSVQYFLSALNHAQVLPQQFLWLLYPHAVVSTPAKRMQSVHLPHHATRAVDLIPEQELYYQPTWSRTQQSKEDSTGLVRESLTSSGSVLLPTAGLGGRLQFSPQSLTVRLAGLSKRSSWFHFPCKSLVYALQAERKENFAVKEWSQVR